MCRATVVPIYQTNSPEECHYVLDHSESKAVVIEDAGQLEKIRKIRGQLPNLEHVISIEPIAADDVITLAALRERGPLPLTGHFETRVAGVQPSDVATYINLWHDRPAKGSSSTTPTGGSCWIRRRRTACSRRARSSTCSCRSRMRSRG